MRAPAGASTRRRAPPTRTRAGWACAAALLALARVVSSAPPAGLTPGSTPATSPLSCSGPEPAWRVSSWWPAGAVFRCGCGLATGGTSTAWNDPVICAALGDLLYATGSPQLTTTTNNVAQRIASWTKWPTSGGWSDAANNVSSNYCSFFQGVLVECGPSATGSGCTKGCGIFTDGRNLTGTLPASFTALAALPDIAMLSFGGYDSVVVDAALFVPFASSLTYLAMQGSTLLGGTLPRELGSLTALHDLVLSTSKLTGTLPPEMGSMSSLMSLNLASNSLSGSLPTAWSGMRALTALTLSDNAFNGTLSSSTLCSMAVLTLLDFSYNAIGGSIPSLSCLSLSYLDFKSNQLVGSIPADLATAMACSTSTSTTGTMFSNSYASLGLAGNMLTGDLPVSLTNKTCIYSLSLQRAVSVCPAGSAETGKYSGTTVNFMWQKAVCAACASGTFSSSPGALQCSPCDAGYYSFANGTGCAPCDAGAFLNITSGACQACWPGSFSARGALTCSPCQANAYAAADGTSCLSCPDGSTSFPGSPGLVSCACATGSVSVSLAGGSFLCRACAAGTFQNLSAINQCSPCPPNTYNAVAGAISCTPVDSGSMVILNATAQMPCPAGSFLNFSTSACATCQPGTYSATRGSTLCPPCPPATIAPGFAATSCNACPSSSSDGALHTACVCSDGYYDAAAGNDTSAPTCVTCADGGACLGGALLAQEGWWRETASDAIFLKCREGYCLAEGSPGAQAAGARRLTQQDGGHCADGHSGPLCAVCLDGYTLQGGFCKACGVGDSWSEWSRPSRGVTIAFFVLAGGLLLALLLLLPLLPALERVLWRCTGLLATAAEGVAGAAGKLRRCCCGGSGAVEAELAPRRSSARVSVSRRLSTARWSAMAFGMDPGIRSSETARLEDLAAGEADPNAGEEGEGDGQDTPAGADGVVALMEAAMDLLTSLAKPAKILINFYQICSTFVDSLDVPWPRTFISIMSRVNIVNVNFLQLPKTSCLYPNTPFYRTFQGYTLGTTAALALVGAAWVAGQRLLAPRSLSAESPAERAHRLRRFQTLCLSRVLLLLYLVYPGVSGVVIAVFNCRSMPSGRSVLVADHRETCWTPQHWSYVGAGIFWVLAVPFGIPAAFTALLYYFRVPHLARAKVADAWLREAAEHCWRLGVAQPPCDVRALCWHNVSDEHLELLVQALVYGEPAETAHEAAAEAAKQHAAAADEHAVAAAARRGGRLRRVRRAMTCGSSVPRPAARRAVLQKTLLHWCEISATLSLPPLAWAEPEDDAPAPAHPDGEAAAEAASSADARRLRGVFSGFSTSALAAIPPDAAAALEQRALRKIGFLFAAYTVQCWPWEIVELARKLLLTSILALVVPGSATQVTVGTLVAFATLLLFQRLRPYAAPGMNFVASVAQVNLFIVLFVGLLLKVRVNGDATDGRLFNVIVGILSVVPIALPVALKASSFAGALDGDELEDAMDEADEDNNGGQGED